jgi:DNA-binding MarR family transcriptional regulator
MSYYQTATFGARDSIGYLLRRSAVLMRTRIESVFSGHGLTFMQWALLLLIRDELAHTASEVSRQMGYDSGAMTRLVDQLETRGLLRRERHDSDRRQLRLTLTPLGQHSLDELMPLVVGVANQSVAPLSSDEMSTLTSLLDRLIHHMEDQTSIAKVTAPCAEL